MEEKNTHFLEEVKQAAYTGAKEGAKNQKISGSKFFVGSLFSKIIFQLIFVLAIFIIGFILLKSFNPIEKIAKQLQRELPAYEHDMVLKDKGILGYTAVDFAEPILGKKSQLKKIEVLEQKVSDVVTHTEAGLGRFKAFSKTQLVTYHGKAIYTLDLSKMDNSSVQLNEDTKEVIIFIPHPELEPINIQSKDIEFGDVNKGILAFGDIKLTPKESAEIQSKAQELMTEKVKEQQVAEDADRFAKLVVWELFQPIVNGVTQGYSLKVEFR